MAVQEQIQEQPQENIQEEMDKATKDVRENKEYSLNKKTVPKALEFLNKYITDEIYESIKKLKKIITRNARIYSKIKGTEELVYDGVHEYIREMNEFIYNEYSKYGRDKCMGKQIDGSNFYKKFSKINFVKETKETYIDLEGNEKTKYKYDDKGCIRNVYIYVLYGQGNDKNKGNNSYAMKTFSRVYVDYVVNNLEDILSDAVTFGVHNSLAFESKDVYDSVRIFSKDENETKKEQILFSYLLERGTGVSFKYLLYNYAQKYYEMLSKEDAEFYYDSMDQYLQYMTSFKQVCLFPDEAFFEELYKIIILLMESKAGALKEDGFEITEQDMHSAFCYKLNEILQELYKCQEKAISSGGESPEFKFPNFTFEKPNDRTTQHVNLWNDVQRYVNTYVMCENPLDRFDMEVHNNLDMYNTVIDGLNCIRSQINALKSKYRML